MKATDFWRKEADKMRNTNNITDTSKVLDTKTVTEDKAPIENNGEYPARGVTIVYSHRGRYLDTIIDENADYPNEVHFINIELKDDRTNMEEYDNLKIIYQSLGVNIGDFIRSSSIFLIDIQLISELKSIYENYSADLDKLNEEGGVLYTEPFYINPIEHKRLQIEWCKDCPKDTRTDGVGASIGQVFNMRKYFGKWREYRMTWHTHPPLYNPNFIQTYQQPSGQQKDDQTGDIFAVKLQYEYEDKRADDYGITLWKMRHILGGPGMIVHKEGITIYRHSGTYLKRIGSDGKPNEDDFDSHAAKGLIDGKIVDGVGKFLEIPYSFWGL